MSTVTSNGLSKVEECREAFEKYLGPKAQLRKHNGYYDAPLIESAWNDFQAGWLASRSAETRACDGCERGLPLDGYGHHYGRISNTGPLAPYYLDLTVCTRRSEKADEGQS